MKMSTEPVEMTTAYGSLFVAVASAGKDTHYDKELRQNVSSFRPRLYVSTDRTFEADPQADEYWVIRRRAYAVLKMYEKRANVLNSEDWQRGDTPYGGGFRNQLCQPVEYHTPTYDLMDAAVLKALDEFASAHPQWADLSMHLCYRDEATSAELTAARARVELAKAEETAHQRWAEAARVKQTLPAGLVALIGEKNA